MTVPSVHAGGAQVAPLSAPVFAPPYVPMVAGYEAVGIVRLRELFDKCPYVGTADELVPVLLAVAGEAICAVVEDLTYKGYLKVPPYALAEIMERVPVAVLHAVSIALAPKKGTPCG